MSVDEPIGVFPGGRYVAALVLILIVAGLPLISVSIAAMIADANGCALEPFGVGSCSILGADWGAALADMARFGLLAAAMIPLGIVAVCVWLIALIFNVLIHRARRPSGARCP